MALTPEQEQRFDEAAELARVEFEAHWKDWNARDVCQWVDRWSERAAYDRLCRIMRKAIQPKLVKCTPATPEEIEAFERLLKANR